VADTSPLVYLVLIDHIEILPRLFETVLFLTLSMPNSEIHWRPRLYRLGHRRYPHGRG
jgi:predicted nucleic acid-binding protein